MTATFHTRRAFLASTAATAVSGCAGFRYRDRYSPGQRVSLTVSAPPADDDRAATTIGRTLTDRLTTLGVDATFEPKGQSQLYLDALINHDFDVFVGRHPGLGHIDSLFALLHSSFAPEPGWQNPFGVASVAIDDALEALRATDAPAVEIHELLEAYVERVPFTVVAAPEFLTARRSDISVADDAVTERPLGVLELLADADLDGPLQAGIFSAEVTENRNPIAGEFRWNRQLLGLLYDPLARPSRDGSTYLPWAASEWYFDGDELVAELRPDQQFHDGSALTADDVVFTLDLLSDTSLGEASSPIPATRFRGRRTLVSGARAPDRTTVRFELEPNVAERTAKRVLTVPVLPESEWRDRTDVVDDRVTQALVWKNPEPVGSGPLAFDGATQKESVTLTTFDDHFLDDGTDESVARYAPALDTDGVVGRYAPSGGDALAALTDGRLHTSLHQFPLNAFESAEGTDGVASATASSTELCIVGYNVRRAPLSDFHFRQVLARLHDRVHAVASIFEGFAAATDVPVLENWGDVAGEASAPSVGSFPGSKGELDAERARAMFEDAGFTYDDDGNLYR